MKKTILLSSVLAVGAAFAGEVTNANAVAALNFDVTTAAAQTLVAVPFEGFEAGGKVKVNDIVKTSNLGDGSKLYVPNTAGKYDTWTLTAGEWKADVQVEVGMAGTPVEKVGVNSTDVSVDRGSAFWIQPAAAGCIYLLGQKSDAAGLSTAGNGWHLLGNASVNPVTIVNDDKVQEPDKDDTIVVQVNGRLRYYTYSTKKHGWRYTTDEGTLSDPTKDPLTIAPGQGFWYNSKVPVESVTFNWSTGVITKIYPKD